jgi:3-hydroxymyristoyl/3-hydroxydecanoyl-(acyl carrier protein) dehydratase
LPDDGWYVTADRAEADADGGFLLRGRADRIVKIEEKRVSLTAMEQALLSSGLLVEARVVELPDASSSRLGVVGVPNDAGRAVLAEGKRALNDRLRAVLLQSVERVALPRRFRFVDRLPANAQGKTPLAALQALFRPLRPEAQWMSRDAERAVARLDVAADLLVFDGHFPGTPVLPGVAQVDWAVRYAAECFSLPECMLRLDALKFQRPVRPGTSLELSLHWRAADRVLGFVYTSDAGTHAGGSVVFRPDGHD